MPASCNDDVGKAIDWLHRALRNGSVGAETNLGRMYYEGIGLTMDKELGAYWPRRAPGRGDDDARGVSKAEVD